MLQQVVVGEAEEVTLVETETSTSKTRVFHHQENAVPHLLVVVVVVVAALDHDLALVVLLGEDVTIEFFCTILVKCQCYLVELYN